MCISLHDKTIVVCFLDESLHLKCLIVIITVNSFEYLENLEQHGDSSRFGQVNEVIVT